jgi:hypothetical protein
LREWDDNEALLTHMGTGDRARLDVMVDAFIRDQLPSRGAGCIAYAARSFEERAERLPDPKRVVVLQFAAALRQRLVELRRH